MSKITNDGLVWHRMLYSCTHMATVSIKGLIWNPNDILLHLRDGVCEEVVYIFHLFVMTHFEYCIVVGVYYSWRRRMGNSLNLIAR